MEGFAEVMSMLVEGCLMNVGKEEKDVVVGVEAEVVGSGFVDLRMELLHVDLE